jgi:hypothetical protein
VQQRCGTDKLAVVLVDVDPQYFPNPEMYLPQAKKILERHKLSWPNVIATQGFHDTVHAFNVSEYGNIVVDAQGIVRGVNDHGKDLERLIDTTVTAPPASKSGQ